MTTLNDLPPALLQTDIPGFPKRQGKVRDTLDLGDKLLIVATDRISTHDVVHQNGIPDKGKILTAMTLFWLRKLKEVLPHMENHLITDDVSQYGHGLERYADQLEERSMLVHKAEVFPVENIARGYLAGSGWKEYRNNEAVCGIPLIPGLRQCDRLPMPLFTPSTKAETGHDENISLEAMDRLVGRDVRIRLQRMTLETYVAAAEWAKNCGVILADTKLEFGKHDGNIMLVDEVLTPDSSRFWPMDRYEPGRDQESFDKQYVRNHAEATGWNKQYPGLLLPDDVVAQTRAKYIEAHDRITGENFVKA